MVLNRYLELCEDIYGDSRNKNLKRHAVSFTKGSRVPPR